MNDESVLTIGDTEEVEISSRRQDGSLRPFVTIWAVRVGDRLFVRSAYGPRNGWFRRAVASGTGAVRARGLELEVSFASPDQDVQQAADEAYLEKYARYPDIVKGIVGPDLHALTLELVPA